MGVPLWCGDAGVLVVLFLVGGIFFGVVLVGVAVSCRA